MCQSTTAVEDDQDGNAYFDSVFLSLTEQANNCSCTVSVKNASGFVNLHIQRLNTLNEQPLCGMEIDILHVRRPFEFYFLNRSPTRCDSREESIYLTLLGDEYLQFTSRVLDGNFSNGYCIQITRGSLEMYSTYFL